MQSKSTMRVVQYKKELIKELFEKFENACYLYEGIECWSAREMQEILAYTDWGNF